MSVVRSAVLAALLAVLIIGAFAVQASTAQTTTHIVLDLLNDRQYLVPHVYQGDDNGKPTSLWPVYYGPNNASTYWDNLRFAPFDISRYRRIADIRSRQPVLQLVDTFLPPSAGAIFWGETYNGSAIKITFLGTYSRWWGGSMPGDGYVIYLFLKPTTWGINPEYNYSIPYVPTVGDGCMRRGYPYFVKGGVITPQSSTPYLVVMWLPYLHHCIEINATGQWSIWVVSNPDGNNASIAPSPSPNVGSGYAGWVGIGAGRFSPKPGDVINITVVYDPTTNTLSGIAYNLNTTQVASFTLNLDNYFKPPHSGNYVFGIGATAYSLHDNWALLYAAVSTGPEISVKIPTVTTKTASAAVTTTAKTTPATTTATTSDIGTSTTATGSVAASPGIASPSGAAPIWTIATAVVVVIGVVVVMIVVAIVLLLAARRGK
jgi:hypothetical protein